MYDTLLVPLDGSTFSERALPLAVTLAQRMQARIILLHVISAPVFPGGDTVEAERQTGEEAQVYLAHLASTIAAEGLHTETTLAYGQAAESILLEIKSAGADLVVMCSHGRSGLGRWIFGSVAEQVLAHSPVPVLLVRPTGEPVALGPESAQPALLVPLDGSPLAETALPHAATLARAFGSTILLLRTVEPSMLAYHYSLRDLAQESLRNEQDEAKAYLDAVAEHLRGDGLLVQTLVLIGWPSDVISYRGATLGPRLVIMATHGRSGVARLLLGSVALEVIRRCPLPVLLVRPQVHTPGEPKNA